MRDGFPARTWEGHSEGVITTQAPALECVGVLQPAPRESFTVNGVQLAGPGLRKAILIGPDDVPLGMVSFTQEDYIEVYMALKELAELVRLRTGAMLSVKTPAECSEEDLAGRMVVAGDASCNSIAAVLGLAEGREKGTDVLWIPGSGATELGDAVRALVRR